MMATASTPVLQGSGGPSTSPFLSSSSSSSFSHTFSPPSSSSTFPSTLFPPNTSRSGDSLSLDVGRTLDGGRCAFFWELSECFGVFSGSGEGEDIDGVPVEINRIYFEELNFNFEAINHEKINE